MGADNHVTGWFNEISAFVIIMVIHCLWFVHSFLLLISLWLLYSNLFIFKPQVYYTKSYSYWLYYTVYFIMRFLLVWYFIFSYECTNVTCPYILGISSIDAQRNKELFCSNSISAQVQRSTNILKMLLVCNIIIWCYRVTEPYEIH